MTYSSQNMLQPNHRYIMNILIVSDGFLIYDCLLLQWDEYIYD